MMTEADWNRMSWHQKEGYVRHLAKIRKQLEADILAMNGTLRGNQPTTRTVKKFVPRGDRIDHTTMNVPEDRNDWMWYQLRAAHSAWNRGCRDEVATIGEREYNRRRKLIQYRRDLEESA